MHDQPLMHGDRVMVFDHRLYRYDVSTPISMTMKPATIVCRYGMRDGYWTWEDLCDVIFDHRPGELSKAHFTSGVKRIEGDNA